MARTGGAHIDEFQAIFVSLVTVVMAEFWIAIGKRQTGVSRRLPGWQVCWRGLLKVLSRGWLAGGDFVKLGNFRPGRGVIHCAQPLYFRSAGCGRTGRRREEPNLVARRIQS